MLADTIGERSLGENPFAEPGDKDRTVIRPMPGGSKAASRPAVAPAAAAAGPDIEAASAGDGPLAIAAAPLLHLLGRLRNTATAPDPGEVWDRARQELRAFERRSRDLGVPSDQVRMAHYALCASLDDTVLNTPWGVQGKWRDHPLAAELHDDKAAGRGFFEQIRSLRAAMPGSRPVMEVMFVCLSLGMMGVYRDAPDGAAQLDRIRHHVFEMIAAAAPASPATLAPDAAGIVIPPPPRGGVPVWVAGSAALAVIGAVYVWCLTGLNAASDDIYNSALTAAPASMPPLVRPPATPPPPPRAVAPGPSDRLRTALADLPDITVLATPAATILRIPAGLLFQKPNATPGPALETIARALQGQAGPIRVLAYTDNQPSHSIGLPSNFALSSARANAVRTALARALPDPARITAEGRADADPAFPNTNAEGRARNRRIEIVLPGAP